MHFHTTFQAGEATGMGWANWFSKAATDAPDASGAAALRPDVPVRMDGSVPAAEVAAEYTLEGTVIPILEFANGAWFIAWPTDIHEGEGVAAKALESLGISLEAVRARSLEAITAVPGTLVASVHQSHAYVDGACLYFTFAGRPPAGSPAAGDDPAARDAWTSAYYRAAWDAVTAATLAASKRANARSRSGASKSTTIVSTAPASTTLARYITRILSLT